MIIHKYIQYSMDNKNITILEKMTIFQIYNQMKEDWYEDGHLIIYRFPMTKPDCDGKYQMINGWTMIDTRNIL